MHKLTASSSLWNVSRFWGVKVSFLAKKKLLKLAEKNGFQLKSQRVCLISLTTTRSHWLVPWNEFIGIKLGAHRKLTLNNSFFQYIVSFWSEILISLEIFPREKFEKQNLTINNSKNWLWCTAKTKSDDKSVSSFVACKEICFLCFKAYSCEYHAARHHV